MNMDEFPLLKMPPDPLIETVATDLEGTLTRAVTVKAIHDYLVLKGRGAESRAIYRRFMTRYMLGRILRFDLRETKNNWMRALIRAFKGSTPAEVSSMCDWVIGHATWKEHRREVIRELQAHLAAGRRVVIVSGMSYPILESLLVHLPGFEAIGTAVLPDADDRFSGELEPHFNVGVRKTERLRPFAAENGKIYGAYGDTFSDQLMLEMSEYPVVVNPDRKLRRAAKSAGWRILED